MFRRIEKGLGPAAADALSDVTLETGPADPA
jgi:hypothetical protein